MEDPPPPPYSAQTPALPRPHISAATLNTVKKIVQTELPYPRNFQRNSQTYHLHWILMDILLVDYGIWKPHRSDRSDGIGSMHLARQLEALGCSPHPEVAANLAPFVQENIATPAAQLGVPFDIVVTMLIRYSANLRYDSESMEMYTGCHAAVYAKMNASRERLTKEIEVLLAKRGAWQHMQWVHQAAGERAALPPSRPPTAETRVTDMIVVAVRERSSEVEANTSSTNTSQLVAPEQSKSSRHQPKALAALFLTIDQTFGTRGCAFERTSKDPLMVVSPCTMNL
ncbi:hypothetical protein LTR22_002016 [Elasticomyces elasticus]|nr:hypothetical protein LTR22_002016 [Elasticomyces elasticus]